MLPSFLYHGMIVFIHEALSSIVFQKSPIYQVRILQLKLGFSSMSWVSFSVDVFDLFMNFYAWIKVIACFKLFSNESIITHVSKVCWYNVDIWLWKINLWVLYMSSLYEIDRNEFEDSLTLKTDEAYELLKWMHDHENMLMNHETLYMRLSICFIKLWDMTWMTSRFTLNAFRAIFLK